MRRARPAGNPSVLSGSRCRRSAAGYGCTSVLLGALLAARDYSGLLVGVILGCIVAGTAVGSLVFGRVADRIGRRRCYLAIFLGMSLAGA